MQEAIILVGNSGSGKSTFAEKFIKAHPNFVRVNKDSIRKCLVCTNSASGYWRREDVDALEDIVNGALRDIILHCFRYEKNIVVDSTNIKVRDLEYILAVLEGKFHYTFRIFEVDIETARARVMKRESFTDPQETFYLEKYEENFKNMLVYLETNYSNKITYNGR